MNQEFHVIYSGNIVHADLLKCVLEGEGIDSFLEDQFIGTIAPYAASAGGAGAVKVLVTERDKDRALKIVDDFLKSNDRRNNIRLVE